MTRASAYASPFRRDGLLRRSAPFLAAMLVGYAAVRLPATERNGNEILAAAAVNAVLIVLVLFLPWNRLPRTAELVPPLMYMVSVAMLRDALGGAGSAYSTLLILPVLWIAMYGTRVQLGIAVTGVTLLLTMPILLIGSPDYADTEWRRALLWVGVSGIIGLAVQDLVLQVRQRAEALHTVSAAVGRRTQEIETRSAICEAAKDNARAEYAMLLEPDANARRLVATAATDPLVEGTVVYLNDTESQAVKTYAAGREYFEQAIDKPVLWHPVRGRDATLGVLAVAWAEPVKRLPETLPVVMEALAAEAAGVIERTTLLLKIESVVKVDEVTGLPNERAWEEEVTRELSDARRQRASLSVVLIDLGEFELLPDRTLSYPDKQLLRAAANRWSYEIRPSDFLAHREPPGRFAALLPGVGVEHAESTATRLRAAAPAGRACNVAVATWNGSELPAAFVGRAETQIELERAAARAD